MVWTYNMHIIHINCYLLFIYSIIKFTWALVGCNVVRTTFSDLQTSWLLKNICKIRSSMPAYCTIIIIHQRNLACLLLLHFIYQCQRLRRDSPITLGVFQKYMMSIVFGGCVHCCNKMMWNQNTSNFHDWITIAVIVWRNVI